VAAPQLEKLGNHGTSDFDCGTPVLNDWLHKYALTNQRAGMTTTYVSVDGTRIQGYVGISSGAIMREAAPVRLAKGTPNLPIPLMIIGRLAVDLHDQNTRLGKRLLGFALLKALEVSEIMAIRAVHVYAKDEEARAFYKHVAEFEDSPVDRNSLFLLMKDLRTAFA